MPRIRSITPELHADAKLCKCSPYARLLYHGFPNFADDYGVAPDDCESLGLKILPADRDKVRYAELVEELIRNRKLARYVATDGRQYLAAVDWDAEQTVNNPSKGKRQPPVKEMRLVAFGPTTPLFDAPQPSVGLGSPPQTSPPQSSVGLGSPTESSVGLVSEELSRAPADTSEDSSLGLSSPTVRRKLGNGAEGNGVERSGAEVPRARVREPEPDPTPDPAADDPTDATSARSLSAAPNDDEPPPEPRGERQYLEQPLGMRQLLERVYGDNASRYDAVRRELLLLLDGPGVELEGECVRAVDDEHLSQACLAVVALHEQGKLKKPNAAIHLVLLKLRETAVERRAALERRVEEIDTRQRPRRRTAPTPVAAVLDVPDESERTTTSSNEQLALAWAGEHPDAATLIAERLTRDHPNMNPKGHAFRAFYIGELIDAARQALATAGA